MFPKEKLEDLLYHFYEIQVVYSSQGDNAYFKNLGMIEINSDQTEEEQYHTLLHELSHVVAMQKKDFTCLGEGGIIMNEFMAWHYSEILIDQLSLPICEENWESFKDCSINSYVKRGNIESKDTVHNRN